MTNQNTDKPEFDEMLSRYIDGEASERERTEIKRLAANDAAFAEKLTRLKNQKSLLNNLPVTCAPSWLTEDIKLSLERNSLLNEQPTYIDEVAGHRNLMYKRVMTAAIILVLCGSLVFIIMQVFSPATGSYDNRIAEIRPSTTDGEPVASADHIDTVVKEAYRDQTPVFTASLNLTSGNPDGMNSYIGKVIYIYDLNENIFKDTKGDTTYYHVSADIDQVRNLLGELAVVWEECKDAKLTAFDPSGSDDVRIDSLSAAQLSAIFKQDTPSDRIEIARDFADFNSVVDTQNKRDSYARLVSNRNRPPEPEKPQLTSGQKPEPSTDRQPAAEKINLTITVQGSSTPQE